MFKIEKDSFDVSLALKSLPRKNPSHFPLTTLTAVIICSSEKGKTHRMKKSDLKDVLNVLKVDSEVTFTFVSGAESANNGNYKVVSYKTTKGRGAPLQVEFVNTDTGNKFSFHSKDNDKVVNITVNGSFYGYQTEAEMNQALNTKGDMEPTLEAGANLKKVFEELGKETGKKVELKAKTPELTGVFTIEKLTKAKGRVSQVILLLRDSANNPVEAWSYKHSNVITDVTLQD